MNADAQPPATALRWLGKYFSTSPLLARVVPFVVIVLLTSCQGALGEDSRYWFYLAKTLVGAWLIWEVFPYVPEMRWTFSWTAVAVGVGVFALWVGISGTWATQNTLWPKLGLDTLWVKLGLSHGSAAVAARPWNPLAEFGGPTLLARFFIVTRILGSTWIVPPLEEAFYRSFLCRYIARPEFMSVPLNRFLPVPFLATALVFGLSHNEWIAGILCGAAYQWLVLRKDHLGDAMTAHAITNFLLGGWVVWRGAWNFW
jgi:membrane protease YdiL (CAAX protease family)